MNERKISRTNCPIRLIDGQSRYSSKQLEQFKERIEDELQKAREDYLSYKDSITHKDGNGTDDTSPTFKGLDEGAITLSKSESDMLASRRYKYIIGLQQALIEIKNGTYGIIPEGGILPPERLWGSPLAKTPCPPK